MPPWPHESFADFTAAAAAKCAGLGAGLDGLGPVWAEHAARASLQGGALIALLWLVCRLIPNIPPRARQWLWALACLKLLVTLLWPSPIAVPILRAPAAPPSGPIYALDAAKFRAPTLMHDITIGPASAGAKTSDLPAATAAPVSASTAASAPAPAQPRGIWRGLPVSSYVMLAYLTGLSILLVIASIRAFRMARIVRAAADPDGEALIETIRQTAGAVGLPVVPCVRVTDRVAGPLVWGVFSPTILIPALDAPASAARPGEGIRLALAHEMVHIKRGDIALAALASLCRLVFWFHPLAALAARELTIATEEACDADTVRATGAAPADYFRLLLRVAEAAAVPRNRQAAALSLSASYKMLRRRLGNLTTLATGRPLSRLLVALAAGLLATAVIFVAPMRLTARVRTWAAAALPAYAVDALPVPADRSSAAGAINDSGIVVGELIPSITRGAGEAYIWTTSDPLPVSGEAGGGITPPASPVAAGRIGAGIAPLPDYRNGIACGINDQGQVIASSYNFGSYHHAYVAAGTSRRIGGLPGMPFSKAYGINGAGWIVGEAAMGRPRLGRTPGRAFLWQDEAMQDLGTLGGAYSCAYGVADGGEVVGKADLSHSLLFGTVTHAFAWNDGQMTDLGTLGGENSVAYAVAGSGLIAGASETGDGHRHACLWWRGGIDDLGALAPDADSEARAVSRSGLVVGWSTLGDGSTQTHAVLWQSGRPIDLNSLLPAGSPWTLDQARGINEHGQIVGSGHIYGREEAFLLSPVRILTPLVTSRPSPKREG